MTNPCDAHKINTSSTQGSGTSAHVYTINPDCGKSLTKLNVSLVQTKSSGTITTIYNDLQKEHIREKTKALDFLVINQWQHAYKETVCSKTNQHDLDTALQRKICLGGINEALFEAI